MKATFTLFILAFLLHSMSFAQEKSTMNIKDLNSSIEKYIKKNYKDFKTVEAIHYSVCFEMKIGKGDAHETLLFDIKGKFLKKLSGPEQFDQTRTTMAVKDVDNDITKYVKKNFPDYKITEAYKYDEAYTAKVTKGDVSETLLFDKDGKFEKKLTQPAAVKEQPKKTDSLPPAKAKKEEPKKADTTKK